MLKDYPLTQSPDMYFYGQKNSFIFFFFFLFNWEPQFELLFALLRSPPFHMINIWSACITVSSSETALKAQFSFYFIWVIFFLCQWRGRKPRGGGAGVIGVFLMINCEPAKCELGLGWNPLQFTWAAMVMCDSNPNTQRCEELLQVSHWPLTSWHAY